MLKPLILVSLISFLAIACSGKNELVLNPADFETKLKATSNAVLLDVRTAEEYKIGHIGDATLNIDYRSADFAEKISKLDKQKTYFVYCRTAKRSASAIEIMKQQGFKRLYDLEGGIVAWGKAAKPISKD